MEGRQRLVGRGERGRDRSKRKRETGARGKETRVEIG
jgi:hypothetical protein